MACPKCGCKVHYEFDDEDYGYDERMQRCAACGEVFDLDDAAEDDDDCPETQPGATAFDGAAAWNAYT